MSARTLPPPTAAGPLLPWLLVALAPTNRTRVKQMLQHGRVRVNGVAVTRHDHPLAPGDRVEVAREGAARVAADAGPGFRVIYEDAAVVVTDKPAGLLTVATDDEKLDTAFARLNVYLASAGGDRPFVVHRLDRDTSGLLLFAKTAASRDKLQANWEAVEKTYLAVVEGVPRPPAGVVENHLLEMPNLRVRAVPPGPDGKRAVSRYRVVESSGRYSLVEVCIETGRKHQVRVHMAGLGCPIVGDEAYRAKSDPAGRLGLHAWRLAFPHPVTGRRVEWESPLPEVLRKSLARG